MMNKTTRAFTLIELLVVISIIGLLSSVVLASLVSVRAKARDARRFSDLAALQKAFQLYAADHDGNFPAVVGTARCIGLLDGATCWGGYGPGDTSIRDALAPYFGSSPLPADPSPTRGIDGDRYLYWYGTVPVGCHATGSGDPRGDVTGHFLFWKPDKQPQDGGLQSTCLNHGVNSCCYGITCFTSYRCVLKID
jgi:prepilin-type N-terminal cleavage/methylation domain-containing protein